MFWRLRRPMCGRSSTFRKLGFIPRGYAPHVVRRTRSKQTGNRRASKPVFAKYKRGGHSPINRNALLEGRRPSAHRAAEPRRKKTYVDTIETSSWRPEANGVVLAPSVKPHEASSWRPIRRILVSTINALKAACHHECDLAT